MTATSIDYDLADALVTALAAELTGMTVEAVADPAVQRELLTELCVRVMPAAYEQGESWRDASLEHRAIHVSIVGPADAADLDSVKAGLILTDRVKALWAEDGTLRHAELEGHVWKPPLLQKPLYNQALLLQQKLFVATIVAAYQRVE